MLPQNSNQPSESITTASDSEMQNASSALIEQNRLLLSRILRDEDNNNINNDNIRARSTSNNGYYVMPDLINSINNFSGRESNTDARAWLKSVEGVAKLHNWPDSFKLEIVCTKWDGPSKIGTLVVHFQVGEVLSTSLIIHLWETSRIHWSVKSNFWAFQTHFGCSGRV